jgi:hypothetical protein
MVVIAVFDFELKLRILFPEDLCCVLSCHCAAKEFAVRLFNCCNGLVHNLYDGTRLMRRISFLSARVEKVVRLTVLPLHFNSMLRSRKCRPFGGAGNAGNTDGEAGGAGRFDWTAIGEVSSSSAMNDECVEELGDS